LFVYLATLDENTPAQKIIVRGFEKVRMIALVNTLFELEIFYTLKLGRKLILSNMSLILTSNIFLS